MIVAFACIRTLIMYKCSKFGMHEMSNNNTLISQVVLIISLVTCTYEGRILLSSSSQGESSVMRIRLEGCKKTHYVYALAHYKCALGGSDVYSTSTNAYLLPLMSIRNGFFTTLSGLVCISNGIFMTLSLTLNTQLSP